MCTYACMCVVVHWLEKGFFLFNKKQHKRSHLAIFCSFSFNFFPACLAFSACDFALCHYVRFRCVADMCSVYYAYDLQHCTIISIPATNNIKNKRPFFLYRFSYLCKSFHIFTLCAWKEYCKNFAQAEISCRFQGAHILLFWMSF